MNILFLSLNRILDIERHEIYTDLLREFIKKGDNVYIVSPSERKFKEKTELIKQGDTSILKVKTLNIQKTNIIEKGLGTVLIEWQFYSAIKKYFKDIKFDLVLYATPPITLIKPISYIKKRDGAKSYLLLKDIFPQNAVDIGMMPKTGLKGILYKVFRSKEKKLYAVSDYIGCMSQANVDYVKAHNPEINPDIVEICPNSIEILDIAKTSLEDRNAIREKLGIPTDKKVFVYGGNLGKPQGIPFIIDCLKSQLDNKDVFFLIVGAGTEYKKLEEFFNSAKPDNMMLLSRMPKDDYDRMIPACDVGMIFLDHRFTIPNFPSRLLAYMQAGLPVFACTDKNTDVGKVVTEGEFGWWCESNDVNAFCAIVNEIMNKETLKDKSENAFTYLNNNYSAKHSFEIISKRIK